MKYFFLFLLLPSVGWTANLNTGWASDGGDKIPQEYCYPHDVNYASSTLSRTWDQTTITPFSALNHTAHFEWISCDTGNVKASSVTVVMSSMTCTTGGIANSVTRTATTVMITTGTPIQVYARHYIFNKGMSVLPLGRDEFEERSYPLDMRVPCTVTAGHCIPNGTAGSGTYTWTNRLNANKHIPAVDVPIEEFATSSMTVSSGTSQSWDVDIYVSSMMAAPNQCQGTFSVFENNVLSTAVPVNLKLYNVTLPSQQNFPVVACADAENITRRMDGIGSCSSAPLTGNCKSSVDAIAKIAHAHNIMMSCDVPDATSQFYPSSVWQNYTSSSAPAFTEINGYGNARGVGQNNYVYLIGQYGGPYWNTSTTGNYCTAVSSWVAYCNTNNLQCATYTPNDEGTVGGIVAQFSEWQTTVTACANSGNKLSFMQTDNLPDTIYGVAGDTAAPYVSWPASTNSPYDDTYPSSTTWDVLASSIIAGNSLTGSLGQVWHYNGAPSVGSGVMFPYEEEGYVPRANFWMYMKKQCPNGICKGGQMLYESTYWNNADNGGSTCGGGSNLDMDVINQPCTFGYDTGPDSVWGEAGFNYSQGDGVLFYPGTDTIFSGSNYGFLGAMTGPIANSIRQGVDDVDEYIAAYKVNPSSATAVLNSVVQLALWEATCVNNFPGGDCTYRYGDRSWSYGTNSWVQAEEQLLEIASGQTPTNPPAGTFFTGKFLTSGKGLVHQ